MRLDVKGERSRTGTGKRRLGQQGGGARTVDVLAAELVGQLGVVDALDDRGVIPLVAEDVHVGEERGQHAQDGVVGDVARGEDERYEW